MFCHRCGTQLVDSATACGACGAVVQPIKPAAPSGTSPAVPRAKPMEDDAAMRLLLPIGRSPLAIAAGYAGLFAVIPFFAPIALALGIAAVWHLKKNPEQYGMGRAIFGLVMGLAGTALLVFVFVAAAMGAGR